MLTIDSAGRAVSVLPDGSKTYATQLNGSLSSVVLASPLALTTALSYGGFSYGSYRATSITVDTGGDILTSEYPLSDTYVRAPQTAASASGTARTIPTDSGASAAGADAGGTVRAFRLQPSSLGLSGLAGIDVVVDSLTDAEVDATIDEETGDISVTGTTVVIDEPDEAIGSVFVTDEDYLFKVSVRFSQPSSSNTEGGVYWFEDLSHRARLVVQNSGSTDAPAATVELTGAGVTVAPTTLTLSSIPAGAVRSFDIDIQYRGADESLEVPVSVMPIDVVVADAGFERRYDLWYTSSPRSSSFWSSSPTPAWNDSGRVISEGNTDASSTTATVLTLDAANEYRAYVQAGDVNYYRVEE